jgi:hypothetical protein
MLQTARRLRKERSKTNYFIAGKKKKERMGNRCMENSHVICMKNGWISNSHMVG